MNEEAVDKEWHTHALGCQNRWGAKASRSANIPRSHPPRCMIRRVEETVREVNKAVPRQLARLGGTCPITQGEIGICVSFIHLIKKQMGNCGFKSMCVGRATEV